MLAKTRNLKRNNPMTTPVHPELQREAEEKYALTEEQLCADNSAFVKQIAKEKIFAYIAGARGEYARKRMIEFAESTVLELARRVKENDMVAGDFCINEKELNRESSDLIAELKQGFEAKEAGE